MSQGDDVVARLTYDEALVLLQWLHRSADVDVPAPVEHSSEQVALWNLSALLERELVNPFKSGNPTTRFSSARHENQFVQGTDQLAR
jgi:hypothetical protein